MLLPLTFKFCWYFWDSNPAILYFLMGSHLVIIIRGKRADPGPKFHFGCSGSRTPACELCLLVPYSQQNVSSSVVQGLHYFWVASSTTANVPTLPGSDVSISMTCLCHFLVKWSCQGLCPTPPRNSTVCSTWTELAFLALCPSLIATLLNSTLFNSWFHKALKDLKILSY